MASSHAEAKVKGFIADHTSARSTVLYAIGRVYAQAVGGC